MLRFTTQSLCARAYQPARRYAVSVRAAEAAKAAKKEAPKNDLKITKKELKDAVKAATHLSMNDTSKAVDALLDAIVAGVAAGKEVAIPGFGTFKGRFREARDGRNPRSGETIKIEAKTAPTFVAGKTFKDAVADAPPPPPKAKKAAE